MLDGGDITIHEAFGKPLVPPLSSSRKAIILVQYSYHGTIVVERRHIPPKTRKTDAFAHPVRSLAKCTGVSSKKNLLKMNSCRY